MIKSKAATVFSCVYAGHAKIFGVVRGCSKNGGG
jgi:hypothetical protein